MLVCLLFVKNSGYLCNWELLATLAEMNCFVSGKLLKWEGKMHRGMTSMFQKKNFHPIEGIKILKPNEFELKAEAIRPTDIENSKTFLIRSGCDTAPIHLLNQAFSSCRSASFNSWPQSLKVLTTPCLRTVLYTAALKYTGMVDSPLQCPSNLLRASARVAWSPLRPIQPNTRPLKSASKWSRTTVDN